MSQTIDYGTFVAMLRGAAGRIRDEHEMLSRLDSVGGDGDHGTTMLRAMKCLEKAIGDARGRSIRELLHGAGWAILGVDGGATGPLLGMLFTGMAEAAGDSSDLDAPALARICESGLASVEKQTGARIGDKTMMDALIPAVAALREEADRGSGVLPALRSAADAATRGALSTKELEARFGRAKNVGERSVGHPDPGATSISLVFQGFVKGVE